MNHRAVVRSIVNMRTICRLSLIIALGACSTSEATPEPSSDASTMEGGPIEASAEASSSMPEAAAEAATPIASEAGSDAGKLPSGTFLWQVFYDRSFAASVAVDSKGGAIVSGTFFKDKDIRLGASLLSSRGQADIMLSRVLPNGMVDWARSYGAAAEDYPVTFVLDKTDRIYMTGLYNGTGNIGGPDFPPFAGTPGRYDISIAALTATGDHRWSKTVNGTADSFAGAISLDDAGNAWVSGNFTGTATIGGTPHASAGSWDVFLARYDEPNGSVGPVLPFGGTGDDRSAVALFTGTDVILLGTFTDTLTMPTQVPKQLVSAGQRDIFVARVGLDGKMISATSFGGPGDEQIARAQIDQNGNVVIAGSYGSATLSVLGGDSLLNAGGLDVFVACLSSTLAHQWSKSFGSDADDLARDLAIGPAGVVVVGGEFRDRITFGDKMYDAKRADAGVSEIDAFVLELSEQGDVLWSYAIGGPAPDRTLGVASDSAGAIYATLTFQSPVDFGFGMLTPDPGQWASALIKLSP
jgi:hypothetical protein